MSNVWFNLITTSERERTKKKVRMTRRIPINEWNAALSLPGFVCPIEINIVKIGGASCDRMKLNFQLLCERIHDKPENRIKPKNTFLEFTLDPRWIFVWTTSFSFFLCFPTAGHRFCHIRSYSRTHTHSLSVSKQRAFICVLINRNAAAAPEKKEEETQKAKRFVKVESILHAEQRTSIWKSIPCTKEVYQKMTSMEMRSSTWNRANHVNRSLGTRLEFNNFICANIQQTYTLPSAQCPSRRNAMCRHEPREKKTK